MNVSSEELELRPRSDEGGCSSATLSRNDAGIGFRGRCDTSSNSVEQV
jgi:hypothetical protein